MRTAPHFFGQPCVLNETQGFAILLMIRFSIFLLRTSLAHQAIFDRIEIANDPGDELSVAPTFKTPYDKILDPFKDDLLAINSAILSKSERIQYFIDKAKDHIHEFFGCGQYYGQNKSPYLNDSNFFESNSSSKDFLVGHMTLTSNTLTVRAGNYFLTYGFLVRCK